MNSTNDIWGAFIAGMGFFAILIAIFQIGLNVGIRTSINLIGEYPAARNYLQKHKKMANVLPYVVNSNE